MSTLAERWQIGGEPTSQDEFISQLARVGICDVGKIVQLYEKGTLAAVQLLSGDFDTLRCEVLGVASNISDARLGQYVIVLLPKASIMVGTEKANPCETNYSQNYAKCIPIDVAKGPVRLNSMINGIHIDGANYSTLFGESDVRITMPTTSLALDTTTGQFSYSTPTSQIVALDTGIRILMAPTYDEETGDLKASKVDLVVGQAGIELGIDSDYEGETQGVKLVIGDTISIVKGDGDDAPKLEFVEGGFKITGNLEVTGSITNPTLEAPKE